MPMKLRVRKSWYNVHFIPAQEAVKELNRVTHSLGKERRWPQKEPISTNQSGQQLPC